MPGMWEDVMALGKPVTSKMCRSIRKYRQHKAVQKSRMQGNRSGHDMQQDIYGENEWAEMCEGSRSLPW